MEGWNRVRRPLRCPPSCMIWHGCLWFDLPVSFWNFLREPIFFQAWFQQQRESPDQPTTVYICSVCIVRIRYIFLSFSFALWIHVRPGLHVTWTHGPGRPRADENHMFICQSLDGQFWRKIKFSKFCTKVRWPEVHTRVRNTYVLMY
jgi:hypothetical protein